MSILAFHHIAIDCTTHDLPEIYFAVRDAFPRLSNITSTPVDDKVQVFFVVFSDRGQETVSQQVHDCLGEDLCQRCAIAVSPPLTDSL